jgi:antitoxin (DNA-binding transcriptional repressor) of toxin-antitoxin stability system
MKKANVSELKNRLSHYLRLVRGGQSVLVYDRDRLVARLEPVTEAEVDDRMAWVAELERRGVLRRPTAKLPVNWLQERVKARSDVVAALLDEREGGR